MERTYKLYEELPMVKKETFIALLEVHKQIMKREEELCNLQLERKSIEQKLIVYLQQRHYSGIQKNALIAYLQVFSGGAPSFLKVVNRVISRLCHKDRSILLNAYNNLLKAKEKTIGLVIKP